MRFAFSQKRPQFLVQNEPTTLSRLGNDHNDQDAKEKLRVHLRKSKFSSKFFCDTTVNVPSSSNRLQRLKLWGFWSVHPHWYSMRFAREVWIVLPYEPYLCCSRPHHEFMIDSRRRLRDFSYIVPNKRFLVLMESRWRQNKGAFVWEILEFHL